MLLLLLLLPLLVILLLQLLFAFLGPHPQRRSQREKPEGRRTWMCVVFCRDRRSRQKIPLAE
jgi:hypothetical protein